MTRHTSDHPAGVVAEMLPALLHLLFPAPCLGCDVALGRRGGALLLCHRCEARLAPAEGGCRTCARPLAVARPAALCGRCRADPPPWDALFAAYLYRPPLVQVVRALKYGGGEFLAGGLARHLALRCTELRGHLDLVTAVPLPWTRLLARGYDQAATLGRALARELEAPYAPLLRRRPGRRQVRLDRRARQRNLRAAFVARRVPPAGATVLLVDDVMTTGATLRAAARVLSAAAPVRVFIAVAARTPEASWAP
jgi:ComF family protein